VKFLNGSDLSQQIRRGVCNLLSKLLVFCVHVQLLRSTVRVVYWARSEGRLVRNIWLRPVQQAKGSW